MHNFKSFLNHEGRIRYPTINNVDRASVIALTVNNVNYSHRTISLP
jgi:hypothetical protein